jgi:hypothetical protein
MACAAVMADRSILSSTIITQVAGAVSQQRRRKKYKTTKRKNKPLLNEVERLQIITVIVIVKIIPNVLSLHSLITSIKLKTWQMHADF